jgi:hypothetical protein
VDAKDHYLQKVLPLLSHVSFIHGDLRRSLSRLALVLDRLRRLRKRFSGRGSRRGMPKRRPALSSSSMTSSPPPLLHSLLFTQWSATEHSFCGSVLNPEVLNRHNYCIACQINSPRQILLVDAKY